MLRWFRLKPEKKPRKGKSLRKHGKRLTQRGHLPQRTCMGCGARDNQSRLLRLIVAEGGTLKVDRKGSGRGGYLHGGRECWHAFVRRKSLHRTFRREISKDVKQDLIRE